MDPSIPCQGRFTPGGKRFFETNPFWRRKAEVGQAAGFGIGDRPDYGAENEGWSVAPNAYGDVSKQENSVRRNAHRKEITLKKRYSSMEVKYRERADGLSGPGPAHYDIRLQPGKASLTHASKLPKWSMQPRFEDNSKIMEELRKPGPAEYSRPLTAGANSPIAHGTLYNITLKGRTADPLKKEKGPGPGQYTLKGISDKYNIMPDYVPSYCRKPRRSKAATAPLPEGDDECSVEDLDRFHMKRAESAPGSLRPKQPIA